LTAVRPKAPARWEVNPALARRQQMDNQLSQVGWAIFTYASQQKPFQRYDKASKTWSFRADLLQEVVNARILQESQLTDPLGSRLTLEGLAKLEKGFTAERLAEALTTNRMHELLTAFVYYTNINQKTMLKEGKWTFPKDVLANAARTWGLNDNWLKDVWGHPFKLVRLKKKQDHKSAFSQFDRHVLVCAGPDGKFDTRDDRKMGDRPQYAYYDASSWWTRNPSHLATVGQNWDWHWRWRNRRFGMVEEQLMLRKAAGKDGIAIPRAADLAEKPGQGGVKLDRGDDKAKRSGPAGGSGGAGPPVRVREYFPETLHWDPDLITDENGKATLALTYADSITTWRLSASASSRGGLLGGVSAPLRVFQDFFVDLDLPVSLTQNDEVAFPVAVYNYLKTSQTVKLRLKKESWFELLDEGGYTRELPLKPNEVTAVKFRIKAKRIGFYPLEVKAIGSKMSDALKRTIEVVPDGKKIEQVVSDRLAGKVTQNINIPEHALPDASKLMVKIYPGVVSQILEGTEGMLRLPGG
jgi:hypothetical protein